jgi:hypothetical protein
MVSVMAGQVCVGFLFQRGAAGVEAYDEQRSLGLFETQQLAIAAIAEATNKNTRHE